MRFQLRHFFGLAVSVLFVFCVSYGTGNDAQAQTGPKTISVFPANASKTARDKVIAGADGSATATDDNVSCGLTGTLKSPMACTVQELVDLADPGDTVMFKPAPSGDDPNVYDDVGEILVTRNGDDDGDDDTPKTITIRGMGSGDDMITFTGKVMFNVKTSNIVIRGFKFKDTEPPDTATMRATASTSTTARAATKGVEYGLSGKTIAAYLAEVHDDWETGDAPTPAKFSTDEGIIRSDRTTYRLFDVLDYYWNDHLFVTVVPGKTGAGELARVDTGDKIEEVSGNWKIAGQSFPVFNALNAMGTIWVDSAVTSSCPSGGISVTNVQVRNNVFENTYLTGVKAGNHSWQGLYTVRGRFNVRIAGDNCSAQVEVIGNTFTDVGGNGPFLQRGNSPLVDGNMNKIADVGNWEAAISFSNVTGTGTGATAVSSKISHNTISGGTYDAIIVMNTPANSKIEITRNNIAASILNGINIVGPPMGTASNLVPTADITVTGNRIWGGSANRFLTKVFKGAFGYEEAASSSNTERLSAIPNAGAHFYQHVVRSCKDYNASAQAASENTVRKNIMPEVWKSNVPSFPWDSSGAPKSLINDAGVPQFTSVPESTTPLTGPNSGVNNQPRLITTVSAIDLIRYRADRCYDLGRIRVVNQKGVTIDNNDLGYVMDASGVSLPVSPDNGVVMSGTGVVPKSFKGNNIAFYKQFAVLSDATFSAAKNYLGSNWRVDNDGSITGVDNNGGEPFETSDEREIGPDPDIMMPDEEAPELVESGDGAPAVNESGTTLTLTFNDMLDATSTPAASPASPSTAFEVRAGTTALLPVTGVSISGSTVVLTLGAAARQGETITVTYTKPDSNPIKDDAGLELDSFSRVAVTNGSTVTATGDGDDGDDGPGDMPGSSAGSTDGGCALASAGSGVDLGALVLLLGAVSFAFGLGRKAKAE